MNRVSALFGLLIACGWWVIIAAALLVGWQHRNGLLLVVGGLMLAVGAWNTAVMMKR